jgi:hypothetical protein
MYMTTQDATYKDSLHVSVIHGNINRVSINSGAEGLHSKLISVSLNPFIMCSSNRNLYPFGSRSYEIFVVPVLN